MTNPSEIEPLRRVQQALLHLTKGLAPFVEEQMKRRFGDRWHLAASRATGAGTNERLDAYGLLKTMLDNWREVFDAAFVGKDKFRARSFVSLALDARNAAAHAAEPLADQEALRYLDAIYQVLKLVKAPTAEMEAIGRLYEEQRRAGTASPEQALGQIALVDDRAPSTGLKSWVEVALPHPDVIANRFKEAEFAADLFAVDAGHATESYGTPREFFAITYLTEGLKRVLRSTLERLAGSGGEPVIGLQTAFGGGKTHTLLAVYHLAKHLAEGGELRELPGLEDLLPAASSDSWPKPKVAVFVGTAKGPDVPLATSHEGKPIRTLWGYLAWRLAGEEGLGLVAEAEAAGSNPGSERLVELFRRAGPSVILLDEVVAFARQLPDQRFEALLSFVQSLTEAAKLVPGVLVVGSLPESDSEAGGERGARALRRLEAVFGRVQSPWLPASGDETYEIIRRRLFQPLDAEGERERERTVKAFHAMYRQNSADFPPETRQSRYLELLRLCYPLHPELLDELSRSWAGLEKFQRTRGVLRFLANVVGVLWHEGVRDPLITPARVPLTHERIRASVLYPLDPTFAAVIDAEVDDQRGLPARLEANPSRRITQARSATRAARAVFLGSAASVGQPNAGITGEQLRLACAEPGDQLSIFGEALRELAERATYLYEENGRYWFSTRPTLNRLADDRARGLLERMQEVDAEIVHLIGEESRKKGGFHRVYVCPDDPTAIDETPAVSLVILGPDRPHGGRGVAPSKATESVEEALTRCRASQRRFRNTLLFVAADEGKLAETREVVAKALAWRSIAEDDSLEAQITSAQKRDAKQKAESFQEAAIRAVRETWRHVLYPVKSEIAGKAFALDHLQLTARDREAIPAAVYDKAKADGVILEKLGPEHLWHALKDIWPEDRPHLKVSEVAEWFASYPYLPRLRDRVVLEAACRDAVAQLNPPFGYAERYDDKSRTYRDLILAKSLKEINGIEGLLVRAAEARALLEQEAAGSTERRAGLEEARAPAIAAGQDGTFVPSVALPTSLKPRRFYGSVAIDTLRPIKSFETIYNEVVLQLLRTSNTKVTLTLEIRAEAEDGFEEEERKVVMHNARELKFDLQSTGFDHA